MNRGSRVVGPEGGAVAPLETAMDEDTLRARVAAWNARAAAAREAAEREACAELARQYAALLEAGRGRATTGPGED